MCTRPITGYMSSDPNDRRLKFSKEDCYRDKPVQVPCGKCNECAKSKAMAWVVRLKHECDIAPKSCVVTLTYNEDNIPDDRSVNKVELSLFIKRLRKRISPKRIRYYGVGEYGGKSLRPHYHIIIFNYDFPDKKLSYMSAKGSKQYRSDLLEKVWTKGFSTVGDCTPSSIAYVAAYIQKKLVNVEAYNLDTGEVLDREFSLMSRRPGIGSDWFDRYSIDTKKDHLYIDGVKVGVPRYYREKLKKIDPLTSEYNRIGRRLYSKNNIRGFERDQEVEDYLEKTKKRKRGVLDAKV